MMVDNDALKLAAAKMVLDLLPPEHIIDVAFSLLDGEIESDNLIKLAVAEPSWPDVRDLFVSLLDEFDLTLPSKRDAVMRVSKEVSKKIVKKELSPIEGASRIWSMTLSVPGESFPDLHTFIYAASEWESRPEDRSVFADGINAAARWLADASG